MEHYRVVVYGASSLGSGFDPTTTSGTSSRKVAYSTNCTCMPNSLNALWSAAMAGVDSFLDSVGRAVMSGDRCRKHWRSFADGMPGLRTLRAACGAQSVERSNVQLESCRRCRPA